MIKKLRRKFIAFAMLSVIAVLGLIMVIINAANYRSVTANADRILQMLCENGGAFPVPDEDNPHGIGENTPDRSLPDEMRENGRKSERFGPETPFNTRFFTVTIDTDTGEAVTADVEKIAAVSSTQAKEIAAEFYEKEKEKGFYGSYRYMCAEDDGGVMYLFVDCSSDLDNFRSFLLASVLVSAAGIGLVFILVMFFSRVVVRPLAESYEKQKRFITDASHEIKTPLTIIDASTEIIEMESGESEWTKSIRNQVRRLTEMTRKLVFLTRMDEGRKNLSLSEFDLSQVVLEAAQSFEAVASAMKKVYSFDIKSSLIYNGDRNLIMQLVSLLIDNAMKYSDDGGKVGLELKSKGKSIELCVTNSVAEIEKGRHDEMFERFYRRDKSRNSQTGGFGIGLSAAQEIVLMHKGKISAVSDDGKSIRFTVLL